MNETALLTEDQKAAARVEAVVRSVADAIVTIDARGAIDSVNPAAESLFGYREEEALGRPFAALLAEPHQDEYAEHLRAHSRGETIPVVGVEREVIGLHQDGSAFAMELIITDLRPMEQRMLVAVARDVRERKRAEAALRQEAEHDTPTGLLSRQSFEHELTRHVDFAARYGNAGSVLELGIDDFREVAETHGSDAAEELLVELTEAIKGRLRKTDVLARLGDDQLGVLLHGAGRAKALAVAEEVLALVRDHPFVVSDQPTRVTLSAGLTSIEERPVTGTELLTEAELAMYSARETGRDQVVEYSAEGSAELETNRIWSERIRQATEKGLFVLVCQPITEVATGRISQYELLLRMRAEDGGLIPPAAFLATAERFGLIQGVDRWVTEQAARLIAAHRDEGRALTLEVNLSGKTMADPNFAAHLQKELATTGIDPAQLIFEVAETAAIAEIERARAMAKDLTTLGCHFALDDFGAGTGSFYHLKHLPIDYLKIDGEFVTELARTPTDQLIVKALVDVCRGLGIRTVAEFVGDDETLSTLRQLGVDYAQGYFLGHPHPVTDLSTAPVSG